MLNVKGDTLKLFRICLHGMQTTMGGQVAWGQAFVAANDPTEAYNKLRAFLDKEDIGFYKDRELLSMELVADDSAYPDCGIRFYQ